MSQLQSQQKSEDMSMAAVGRQFMRLAVENEQLRTDLQRVVEMFNGLREENTNLKAQLAEKPAEVPAKVGE